MWVCDHSILYRNYFCLGDSQIRGVEHSYEKADCKNDFRCATSEHFDWLRIRYLYTTTTAVATNPELHDVISSQQKTMRTVCWLKLEVYVCEVSHV